MREWIDASDNEIRLSSAIGFLFGFDQNLTEYLFDRQQIKLRKRPGILRDDLWKFDARNQIKIKAALDIWSGSGHLYLFEMLEGWGQDEWIDFIKSVSVVLEIDLKKLNDEKIDNAVNLLQEIF